MPAITLASPASPIFDVNALRRLSTAGSGSGSGSTTGPTSSTDDGPELKDDPAHREDWSKITAPAESWAIRERRLQSMWARAEIPAARKPGRARHGSVLSVWVACKDRDGHDILGHDSGDEDEEVVVGREGEEEQEEQRDPTGEVRRLRRELAEVRARLARLETSPVEAAMDDGEFRLVRPVDVTGEAERRRARRSSAGAGGGGAERRGSILSLWAQGTDKLGRPVIMHHDEEWKKEDDEVIAEEVEPAS